MTAVKRTERGWPGHFIGGRMCMFRRNTLLECDGVRIVVSTVGDYHPFPDKPAEEIGYRRHYETMVFRAEFDGHYWDANACEEIVPSSPWSIYGMRPGVDNEANDMHEAVVSEMTAKMLGGLL